jgi:ribosomal protein L37AE/L43A
MRCPAHVCVEMVLVPAGVPQFVRVDEASLSVEERRARKVWKCPAPECHCVTVATPEPARHVCPKCGNALTREIQQGANWRCMKCKNARRVRRDRARRAAGRGRKWIPRPRKDFEIRLKGARAL